MAHTGPRLFIRGFKTRASSADTCTTDFFRNTTGRWLWGEKEQLLERHREFKVRELQTTAADTLGSRACVSMSKIGEGNFNKVFRLVMNDRAVAIARIPHPNAGPSRYTTMSEVATMEFARSMLKIPVPKVLAWSSSPDNSVGVEYIVMEEANGTQLSQTWDGLKIHDRSEIINDIVSIEQKLLSVTFDLYGSLYFAKDTFPGCQPAKISGDITEETKDAVRSQYVIGPTSHREFWEKERAVMSLDRGPWKSASGYVESIARREIAWISQYAKRDSILSGYPRGKGSQKPPEDHIALLERYLAVVSKLLPDDTELVRPTLWYPDIHDGNIFVQDGRISSLIDWQSVWVAPLLLQARTPRLIDYNGDIQLRLPEDFKMLPEEEKDQVRDRVQRSIQVYLYEHQTAKFNPLLNRAIRKPHGKTLGQLVSFAGNSWDDHIVPLRDTLIDVERDWLKIFESGKCPYHFSPDERSQHCEEAKAFNAAQEFWEMLQSRVQPDGWTSVEDFDDAVEYFSQLREAGLASLEGEERDEFEASTRWVVDRRAET
ncbi:phosphotransferase enzyme family protein [Nannizzia gypsea CBS 118893]|uniref:Phosphotransferase enzyme family protein n=1 Tax=Arthroderma gypseum (strain ATCC MYA-4604 / CBS 118893) TaxID=535722 RepID=E4UT22_ARTGP|nr:phosphotransferase enzyme family protein [Nannizzia gypsea CBS 118893]EFR00635.1 phosphotransferase enzyme family protein [Nannizzia gypsea CBS 118893]